MLMIALVIAQLTSSETARKSSGPYRTIFDNTFLTSGYAPRVLAWQRDENARRTNKIKEWSYSCEDDLNGNWSDNLSDIRISLRFDKETYTIGEPIFATVLIRNTGDKKIDFNNYRYFGVFDFTIIDAQRNLIPVVQAGELERPERRFSATMAAKLEPFEQRAYEEIDATASVPIKKTGDYYVNVHRRLDLRNPIRSVELRSGTALIHVVEKRPDAGPPSPPPFHPRQLLAPLFTNSPQATAQGQPSSFVQQASFSSGNNTSPIQPASQNRFAPVDNGVKGQGIAPVVVATTASDSHGQAFAILGLASLGLIAFILIRARSRAASQKPHASPRR